MTSYSKAEKLEIAERHLVPKLLEDHGMKSTQVELPRETLELVIDAYTREAGVRNLTRELAHLCRAAAEALARENPTLNVVLSPDKVETILGPRKFFTERVEDRNRPGVVTGLAWTPVGGEILNIEVTKMEGKGNLLLTGHLGDVMKESAQIGVSLLRSSMGRPMPFRFDKTDFHVHVPSGAIPKDGPSAGVAIFLALASLLENKPVSSKMAFTGELTLRGTVLPVGGIKEKVLAAHRAGIETVVLPERNQGDLSDVSPDVRNQMKFHFVKDIYEVLPIAGLAIPLIIPGLKQEPLVAN
jgi:ATP-dependent Lon protease